jgi:hypothetical protein
VGARERSSGAWLPVVVLWGVPVLLPGGCRLSRGASGFLGAVLALGGFLVRAWAGRIASAGAVRFRVARFLARWPSPRLASTSAADAAVAGGGRQPGHLQRDGERLAQDVPVRGGDGDREVPGVHVDRDHRGGPELVRGRGRPRRGPPRRVDVPAAPYRVAGDVVAHCPGGGLGGNFVAPVFEPDLAGQPVAAAGPVREVRERGGQPDLEPALVRVPAQGLVSPCLVLFAVGFTDRTSECSCRSPEPGCRAS